MAHLALYRQYRPQKFSALIGQEHIAKVLSAAAEEKSFVHAYLFCGPRGTGKTSTARILARAINCLDLQAGGEPCNNCAACLRSQNGESLDILEIDSASNRGIDEIRDLRERVKYAPAQEKYKIYIIDEVHMLTREAFNALLKTLEEPPGHVIFILATTAPHKLPLTVLSRCQRFDFRPVGQEAMKAHLQFIAGQENIRLEEAAAELIVRKADGGMRDAVSLLDQCAAAAQGHIDTAQVELLLGIVDRDFLETWQKHLLTGDIAAVMEDVAALAASGKDMHQAVCDLAENTRNGLIAVISGEKAAKHSKGEYVALLAALADAEDRLRRAIDPRISLELALLKYLVPPENKTAPFAPQQGAEQRAAGDNASLPRQGRDDPKREKLWGKLQQEEREIYILVESCGLLPGGEKELILVFPKAKEEEYRAIVGNEVYRKKLAKAVTEIYGQDWHIRGKLL